MAGPNEITPSQLLRLIGTANAPVLIDICTPEDFAEDPRVIPTARRVAHDKIRSLAPELAGKRAVVICQKGKKLSQGAAALLRCDGITAETLEGGVLAWRDAGGPLVPVAALPARIDGTTLWVTRHRPKIDRIACPWLIRRFIDPAARFLFVAPAEVLDVASRFNATPFDIEGVAHSHDGPLCTFDTLLRDFGLETDPLLRLAKVVRGADTDDHALTPQSAGLLAISVGLSRMYKDDLMQLDAGLSLYDALYAWARDGFEEGHDWPADRKTRP